MPDDTQSLPDAAVIGQPAPQAAPIAPVAPAPAVGPGGPSPELAARATTEAKPQINQLLGGQGEPQAGDHFLTKVGKLALTTALLTPARAVGRGMRNFAMNSPAMQQRKQIAFENQQKQQEMQMKQQQAAREQTKFTTEQEKSRMEMNRYSTESIFLATEHKHTIEEWGTQDKEARERLHAMQTANQKGDLELQTALTSALSSGGEDPTTSGSLIHAKTPNDLGTPQAKAIAGGHGVLFLGPHGPEGSADGDKSHDHPGLTFMGNSLDPSQPLQKDVRVIGGYAINPKTGEATPQYRTIPAGHPGYEAIAVYGAARQQLADQMKQVEEKAKLGLVKAETAHAYAGAEKERAEAKKAKQDAALLGAADSALTGAAGEADKAPPLIQEIGAGKMPLNRIEYLLARKPEILAAVSKYYPDFDGSKVKSYIDTYKDFTSGKTSVALNSGATALKHLNELRQLNTNVSHVPHSPAWTAYQNKADTVSSELARFYGDTTIPAIASIKETLASTLPGNREAAIRTQAASMADKFASYHKQWTNAAPSKTYQAPMPGIDDESKHALAQLAPEFSQSHPEFQVGGGKSESETPQIPVGAQLIMRDNQPVGYILNGKRVDF